MKRAILIILLTLVASSAHVTTSQAEEQATVFRVFASKAIANNVARISKSYEAEYPTQHIVVTGGLISKGFPLFFEGNIDLAISSRLMNAQEAAIANEKDCKLSHIQCAAFMVSVIVHPENPLQEISLLDLSRIYSGEITNWKQIGGFAESIYAFGRHYPKEGIAVAFTRAVMGTRPLDSGISLRDYDHDMVRSVSSTRGGIGYVRSDAVNTTSVKVLALKRNGSEQPLLPIPAHLKDSSYPIIAKLTAYWNEKSPQASFAAKFADHCSRSLANEGSCR